MIRFTTILNRFVAAVAASSQATTTSSYATPTLDCHSALASYKAANPSPTTQPTFKLYMDYNDPFDRQCLSAPVPGLSLIERNRFVEDYEKQVEW